MYIELPKGSSEGFIAFSATVSEEMLGKVKETVPTIGGLEVTYSIALGVYSIPPSPHLHRILTLGSNSDEDARTIQTKRIQTAAKQNAESAKGKNVKGGRGGYQRGGNRQNNFGAAKKSNGAKRSKPEPMVLDSVPIVASTGSQVDAASSESVPPTPSTATKRKMDEVEEADEVGGKKVRLDNSTEVSS